MQYVVNSSWNGRVENLGQGKGSYRRTKVRAILERLQNNLEQNP